MLWVRGENELQGKKINRDDVRGVRLGGRPGRGWMDEWMDIVKRALAA